MCTAVASFIGPVMNLAMAGQQAGIARQQEALAYEQASVERQMLYEQYREQQQQYETNKKLALEAYDLQSGQLDKQTVENVKEIQRAAFDQALQGRQVQASVAATNATLGRTGVSVGDARSAIEVEKNRNLNRLAYKRDKTFEYGQDLKQQAKFEAEGRIASVLPGKISPASLRAIEVNKQAALIGAQQTRLQAMGTAIGGITGFANAFSSMQSMQSQSTAMQQNQSLTQQGFQSTRSYLGTMRQLSNANANLRLSSIYGIAGNSATPSFYGTGY